MRTHTTAKNLASVLAAGALSIGLLAAPAHALPVPDAERLAFDYGRVPWHFWPDTTLVTQVNPVLTRAWDNPPYGTTANFVVTSCGRTLREQSVTTSVEAPEAEAGIYLSPNGTFPETVEENSVNRLVGPAIEVTATVTHPGHDPYVLTATIDVKARIPDIPSCTKIAQNLEDGGGSTPSGLVRSWSKKKSLSAVGTKAVAGRKAKITATKVRRGSGVKISYAWRVGGKVIDRDRVAKFRSKHVGKPVKVVVTVKAPGKKAVERTLRYGKVRKAA